MSVLAPATSRLPGRAGREVEKLARRLGFDGGATFLAELECRRGRLRELYRELVARERA